MYGLELAPQAEAPSGRCSSLFIYIPIAHFKGVVIGSHFISKERSAPFPPLILLGPLLSSQLVPAVLLLSALEDGFPPLCLRFLRLPSLTLINSQIGVSPSIRSGCLPEISESPFPFLASRPPQLPAPGHRASTFFQFSLRLPASCFLSSVIDSKSCMR